MLRISTKVEFKNKVSKPYNTFLTLVENTYPHNTKPYYLIYRILQLNLARTHINLTITKSNSAKYYLYRINSSKKSRWLINQRLLQNLKIKTHLIQGRAFHGLAFPENYAFRYLLSSLV